MTETEAFSKLRSCLENNVRRTMESPTDFDYLAADIQSKLGESVSATTLKRFYGYISPSCIPRTSTLSILARYVGFSGWDAFMQSDNAQSAFLSDRCVKSQLLKVGDCVRFGWDPDRMCVARHLGDCRFEVIYAENGHVKVGDSFVAPLFSLNAPLTLTEFRQKSQPLNPPASYMVGNKTGLTHLSLCKSDES